MMCTANKMINETFCCASRGFRARFAKRAGTLKSTIGDALQLFWMNHALINRRKLEDSLYAIKLIFGQSQILLTITDIAQGTQIKKALIFDNLERLLTIDHPNKHQINNS